MITVFYSLSRDPGTGGTLVRGGISATGVGWAGWGFGGTQMSRTKAVIVKTDTTVPTGVSIKSALPIPGACLAALFRIQRWLWAASV